MFKIGEFSRLTQVTVRMLRYYDEMGLLKPAETDSFTGYRLYSAEQIPVLNKIIYLRDSGFQVLEIAEALKNNNKSLIAEQLDKKYAEIEASIKSEQEKLEKIMLAKKELAGGNQDLHYQISIKTIPSYYVLSLRKVIPDYYGEGELWKELSLYVNQNNIVADSACQTFSIYHDEDYREKNVDVELCMPVKKSVKEKRNFTAAFTFRYTEPVSAMACTMVYGSFSNIAGVYLRFAGWLQENKQYQMCGASRQIVHRGPWNEKNPELYVTEIQIPLEMN